MKIKFLLIFLALAVGYPALAADWSKGPGRGLGYGLGPCADAEANLSGEQAAKLKAIQSEYLKSVHPLQRELVVLRRELKMCRPNGGKETNRTAQLRRTVQEHHEKIREIWLRYKIGCRELLSLEQRERLDSSKVTGGADRVWPDFGEGTWNRCRK